MRFFWTCLFALAPALAQAPVPVPRIGEIEFYGLHRVPEARLRRLLGVQAGDPLPPSKGDLEDKLEKTPGVVLARLEAVCCQDDGNAILFVGIEERGAPHFALRSPPAGDVVLPESILDTYHKFLAAVEAAGRRGRTAEDLTEGHSLMADLEARALQQQFLAFTAEHLELVRKVLRNAGEPEERAAAAVLIGYAPDKRRVVGDLEYAMQDPEEAVRANAMRSLDAIAVLAVREPRLEIRVPATWFVEMLNSLILSDRFRAATALVHMTEKDDKAALDQIRERALSSVLEMAQWKALRYALPSYILLGRIVGLSEQAIQDSWSKGDRDVVILRLLKKK